MPLARANLVLSLALHVFFVILNGKHGRHRKITQENVLRVAVFSSHPYDREFLNQANIALSGKHELHFFEAKLNQDSAGLAAGYIAVCAFVNDRLGREVLEILAANGTKFVALRSAGFNHVDLKAARDLNIVIARVPAYSPEAVAEHTVALILSLNRKVHKAYARVREGNFSLEGMLGFDLCGRTVGIIGTGKIGLCVSRIMRGFGCRVIAFDPMHNPEFEASGGNMVKQERNLNDFAFLCGRT